MYSLFASVFGVIILIGTFGAMIAPWFATKITCKNTDDRFPGGKRKTISTQKAD